MFINKIDISSFGKIENKTFKFDNGLNLLYGSNESGKSTIMAFVRFVFYGMKPYKSGDSLSFKEKYMPWSGKAASGSLCLTDENGNKYIISRLCSSTKNKVTVVNALTGEEDKSIDINLFITNHQNIICILVINNYYSVTVSSVFSTPSVAEIIALSIFALLTALETLSNISGTRLTIRSAALSNAVICLISTLP